MVITKEIKEQTSQAATVSIVALSNEGESHLIIVGKVAEVRDEDALVFGIFKMPVAIATQEGGPKGYRLSGQASIDGKQVLFKVKKAELLL